MQDAFNNELPTNSKPPSPVHTIKNNPTETTLSTSMIANTFSTSAVIMSQVPPP